MNAKSGLQRIIFSRTGFILILILKAFFQTIETSALENKVKNLTQRLAIEEKDRQEELAEMKKRIEELEKKLSEDK